MDGKHDRRKNAKNAKILKESVNQNRKKKQVGKVDFLKLTDGVSDCTIFKFNKDFGCCAEFQSIYNIICLHLKKTTTYFIYLALVRDNK